jgi:hypothetical protein
MMIRIILNLVPLTIMKGVSILSIADHTMMLVTVVLLNINKEGIED